MLVEHLPLIFLCRYRMLCCGLPFCFGVEIVLVVVSNKTDCFLCVYLIRLIDFTFLGGLDCFLCLVSSLFVIWFGDFLFQDEFMLVLRPLITTVG